MRKYLIAAIAAITAIAFASVAIAQTQSGGTLKVSLSPKKAGTKKHPRNESMRLVVNNNDTQKTLKQIDIQLPKTITASGKGLKTCKESKLINGGPSACPKASRVGGGTAKALLGVNLPAGQQQPLNFDVTAVGVGAKALDFYLHSTTLTGINVVSKGRLKHHGRKLIVKVPQEAQQPAPGVWAGLISLDTKIHSKKRGKHMLIASTGCKHHKQPFSATLHFANNGVTSASKTKLSTSAKCK